MFDASLSGNVQKRELLKRGTGQLDEQIINIEHGQANIGENLGGDVTRQVETVETSERAHDRHEIVGKRRAHVIHEERAKRGAQRRAAAE